MKASSDFDMNNTFKDPEFIKQFDGEVEQEDLEWRYIKSMHVNGRDHTLIRDNRFGIQKETYKKSTSYFIDDVPNEFSTIEELLYALNMKIKAFKQGLTVKFYGAIVNDPEANELP